MPFIALDPTAAEAAPAITFGAPLTSTGETLASLRAELLLSLGSRSDVSPTRADKWINVAYKRICASLDLDLMEASYAFTSVASQSLYLLPGGVSYIREVSLVDATDFTIAGGTKLNKIDLRTFRRLPDMGSFSPLYPEDYFRYGSILVTYPTTTAELTMIVDLRVKPAPLVADTDSPFIPDEYHDSILLLARQIGFSRLLEFDKAAAAQNEYVDSIREKDDPKAQEDTGRIVRSSFPRRSRSINATRPRIGWRQLYDSL